MEHWVKELLSNLDSTVDEKIKHNILEKCGAKCPFSHMPDDELKALRDEAKNEQEFLEKLCEIWRLRIEDGEYYIVFDQCYCPLVQKDIQNSSKTMCYCTLGSLKHKFRISLGRNVDIEMQKTVLAGDEECRFKIIV